MAETTKWVYEAADDSFLVNDDPALTPVRINLPSPPPLHLIDGYGLPPREQRFEYQVVPPKLVTLERQVRESLNEKANTNSSFKVTGYKIQEEYWKQLIKRAEYFTKEIEWIKTQWYYRVNGYWFFNNGKPTYIAPWHYTYLNWWHIDAPPTYKPQYRDRDRRWFLFNYYAYTTRETFADIDPKTGRAIKVDGVYRMKEMPWRTFYGTCNTKHRRAGETHKSICIVHELVSTRFKVNGGIMSYTADNAGEHFEKKLVPSWRNFPIFFTPAYDTSNTPSESIRYRTPSNTFTDESLDSFIDYAKTADPKYYDGTKLIAVLMDEEGKTVTVSVPERWDVVKECLALGSEIVGFAIHPSTVEEMEDKGGKEFKQILDQSDFYVRFSETGRTKSGLARQFYGADDCLEGFVDSYGMPVRGEVKPYQREEGFQTTSDAYIKKPREALLAAGDPASIDRYRASCRLYPLQYMDSWIGNYGGIGFDIVSIDKRIAELNIEKSLQPRRGDFIGEPDTGVFWQDNPETGRFYLSIHLPSNMTNRRSSRYIIDQVSGDYKRIYEPDGVYDFIAGSDSIGFLRKSEAKLRNDKSKLSDGGGAVFWVRDKKTDPDNKPIEQWESNRFVCTYLYRPPSDEEYAKDMLRMCVYLGAMMYPETNRTAVWEYFIKWGYDGYLLYDVDSKGKIAERPGAYTGNNKSDFFSLMKTHVSKHVLRERHLDLLEQLKNIGSIDEMTSYDLLTAALMALWGARSRYNDVMKRFSNDMPSLNDLARVF